MEKLVEKHGLMFVEKSQFLWRNAILGSWTKEEIMKKRVLSTSAIKDFVASVTNGFQVYELDNWVEQNIFKRGLEATDEEIAIRNFKAWLRKNFM